jgi:hypothetical protein
MSGSGEEEPAGEPGPDEEEELMVTSGDIAAEGRWRRIGT